MEENGRREPDDDFPRGDVIIIIEVFIGGAEALFSLILGWLLGHNPLETFKWNLQAVLWGVVATVPLILLSLAVLRWPVGPLASLKDYCDKEVVPRLERSSWSDLALISLSISVGDEMLSRGVLQASFSHWFGVPVGLGLASMLVALLQPISVQYVVMTGLLGLYLGGVWIVCGNLLTVMVAHALYEFAALSYLVRIRPRGGINSVST
jgi:membrane protease YdiL (CAAX protease family)